MLLFQRERQDLMDIGIPLFFENDARHLCVICITFSGKHFVYIIFPGRNGMIGNQSVNERIEESVGIFIAYDGICSDDEINQLLSFFSLQITANDLQ